MRSNKKTETISINQISRLIDCFSYSCLINLVFFVGGERDMTAIYPKTVKNLKNICEPWDILQLASERKIICLKSFLNAVDFIFSHK